MNCRISHALTFLVLALGVTCSTVAQTQFNNVTVQHGLDGYRGNSGDLHAPGGVFTDLNNDGYPDLYLVSSDGAAGFNSLYLNVSDDSGGRTFSLQLDALGADNETRTGINGTGSFTQAGNTFSGSGNPNNFRGTAGAAAADYDNDGDTDLYVINMGGTNRLYQNQLSDTGTLEFVDVTASAGVSGFSTLGNFTNNAFNASSNRSDDTLAATWFDPDRDGDLDLYVGTHNDQTDNFPFEGAPDTFYRNNGDGTFEDVTEEFDLDGNDENGDSSNPFADTNAVVSADIDNDGWVDLIVTNKSGDTENGSNPIDGDQNIDQILMNRGNDASGNWLGYENLAYTSAFLNSFGEDRVTRSGMGIHVGDVDNDGDLDIYISDNPESRVSGDFGASDLFVNQLVETGSLSFQHGLVDTGLSWGVMIADFDNDGDVEIHTTNDTGANEGYAALLEFGGEGAPLLRNFTGADNGNPLFESLAGNTLVNVVDIAAASGAGNLNGNGRGNLAADFNHDGRLDLFIVNINNDIREGGLLNDPSVLLENVTSDNGSFLNLKLVGNPDDVTEEGFATSRDAIGSRVFVSADIDGDGTDESLIREILGGGGNAASTSSYNLHFGLGDAVEADISVRWADGRTTELGTFSTNQFLVVDQALAGDFDLDGDVDADDIDFYGGNLDVAATGSLARLDLNGDGMVTLADHDLHVTTLVQIANGQAGSLIGDIDLDGSVTVLDDAFILIRFLGSNSGGYANGDLDANLVIDVLGDAFILIGNLGQTVVD